MTKSVAYDFLSGMKSMTRQGAYGWMCCAWLHIHDGQLTLALSNRICWKVWTYNVCIREVQLCLQQVCRLCSNDIQRG